MLLCPNCRKEQKVVMIYGALVYGHLSVELDDEGNVVSTGAVSPHCVVKQGKELQAKGVTMSCSNCGYSGLVGTFPNLRTCPFTGEEASATVSIGDADFVVADSFVETFALLSADCAFVLNGEFDTARSLSAELSRMFA